MAVSLPGHGDTNPIRQNTATRQLSEELDKVSTDLTAAVAAEAAARIAADALKAPIDDPVFTGDPQAPTPAEDDDSTSIATTAYVQTEISGFAPVNDPVFTGDPQAPTPAAADDSTSIATTAYVQDEISGFAPIASPVFTGTPEAPTAAEGTDTTQIATTAFVQAAAKWKPVIKTSNQNVASSTTLVDDSELIVPVLANTDYVIRAVLFVSSGAGGFLISCNGPATPNAVYPQSFSNPSAGNFNITAGSATLTYGSPLALNAAIGTLRAVLPMNFYLSNGANAGNFVIQFTQNSSNLANTTMLAGSYLEYMVIS